ncbi:MAG TPA: YihY/virulence factor BrkB family protein [Candidatus Binatia bacterium]|nr:YihY/virulence factor BrkB family protein [Candidatus Binatia bacterium]
MRAVRLRDRGPIALGLSVAAAYDRAGGGLLAAGLAYEALFALVPAFVLVVGIVGLVVDPEAAAGVAAAVGVVAPPLESLAAAALEQVRQGALAFSVVGLVGLAWGASRLYRALDDAVGRIFHAAPRRGPVARAVRGLVVVGVEVALVVGLAALTGLAAVVETVVPGSAGSSAFEPVLILLPSALSVLVLVVLAAAVYRWVPNRPVAWRALLPPALAAGSAIALFSHVFAFLAPRLLGVGVLFGSIVTVLAALVWLGIASQILLLGAAWTRWRVVGESGEGGAGKEHRAAEGGAAEGGAAEGGG